MAPLMTFVLFTVAVSVIAAPHRDNPVTDNGATVDNSPNEVNPNEVSLGVPSKKHINRKINDAKDMMNSKEEFSTVNSQEFLLAQKFSKISKKSRKHKNFYFNYPYIPQVNKYTRAPSPFTKNHKDLIEEKSIGYRKKQQESDIFYVRLPPTPYYFVPGLGYISNPPTFTTSDLRPQQSNNVKPNHPHSIYSSHKNTLINLPIDFVSNGKPTNIYQWENNNRKTTKRPNTQLNKLNKGPYGFNGRPSSLYLLTSNGKETMHQPIRYNDVRGNNIY